MKPIIFPYKMESKSAKLLAEKLEALRVYPDRNYIPKANHLIINWGSGRFPTWWNRANPELVLNHPAAVATAIDKIDALRQFSINDIPTVDYTTDRQVANEWARPIVVRHSTQGMDGAGLELFEGDDLPQAPLYTKYKHIYAEWRVHVFRGQVIELQEKRKKRDTEVHPYIRTSSNGWVFCKRNIVHELSNIGKKVAIDACSALGLDFGGVDMILTDEGYKVLEVNTAPGIDGTDIGLYAEAISSYVRSFE